MFGGSPDARSGDSTAGPFSGSDTDPALKVSARAVEDVPPQRLLLRGRGRGPFRPGLHGLKKDRGLRMIGVALDPGTGAAVGATAGAVRGRRQQKKANKQAEQQAQQQGQAQQQQRLDTFRRAFSACIDSKGYSVK